jgi:hypothetical protein
MAAAAVAQPLGDAVLLQHALLSNRDCTHVDMLKMKFSGDAPASSIICRSNHARTCRR